MNFRFLLAALVAATSTTWTLASESTSGKAEHLIAQGGECVRLFHSQGDVGCRSVSDEEMAPLYPVRTKDDLDTFFQQASANEKHALVLPEHLLSAQIYDKGRDVVAGLFVYPVYGNRSYEGLDDHELSNVSYASTMPQGHGSPDAKLNPFASKKVEWNPEGKDLLDQSVPFPVVLLQDGNIATEYLDRADTNVQDGPGATYKAYMKYYFGPKEMNSTTCLLFRNMYGTRSPKCDPIGGQSTFAYRGPDNAKDVVLVMASMDATALSHILAPGANAGASGLVALLAAAKALQVIPNNKLEKRLVFTTFQAESYGFVGSRRFLSDLQHFQKKDACKHPVKDSSSIFGSQFCTQPMLSSTTFADKLSLDSISYAIAVDQVGCLSSSKNFTLHLNPNSKTSSKLLDTMRKVPGASSHQVSSGATNSIPPSPLLSFLNENEYGDKKLVSGVLTGYDDAFVQGMYHSRFDTLDAMDSQNVASAAQILAETVLTLATGTDSSSDVDKIVVDKELVENLMTCVSSNWTCDLFTEYTQRFLESSIEYMGLTDTSRPTYKVPATLYAGPMNDDRMMLVRELSGDGPHRTMLNDSWSDDNYAVNLFPNAYEMFTRAFLASAMAPGKDVGSKSDAGECTKSQDCDGHGKECVYPGVCATQQAFFHEALSPGLQRTDQLMEFDVIDDSMPLWTEPTWAADIGSYVFPDPGPVIGWVALAVGVVVTIAGVFAARFVLRSVEKRKLL